jgi:pentachlorophenol monooxygenase/3-(3-hydroxy-phenyl)propionate hydroxylase
MPDAPVVAPPECQESHFPDAGRPERGFPDTTGAGARRFRELARDGFLLLAAPGADIEAARAAAGAIAAPVRVLELAEIDTTGALTKALNARPGELWVVRPDAHAAAVLTHPTAPHHMAAILEGALRRALGDREENHAVLPTVR